MKDPSYLIVFREHPLDPLGINSGAEMATLYLARGLVRAGKRVILCAQVVGGERFIDGIEYWDLGASFNIADIFNRARELGQYHLISAGRALPILMSRNESSCISRALITHDRTSGDSGISPRVLEQNVDTIFCVSEAQKEVFIKDGVGADKLIVFHNGVDLERFKAGQPANRDLRKLIFVGALIVDKGIHLLIESFAKLKARYADLSLDVYGSASLWGRNEFLDTDDLARQIPGLTFHGKVSQEIIATAYAQAGLCVIPSIWFDPFPLVSIDAQACGCPVAAFDVGGLREGIEDGVTGVIIPEISEKALTEHLDRLLVKRETLKHMSQNCLERSRGRFTWEKVVACVIQRSESMAATRSTASVQAQHQRKGPKVGFLSTWNQPCGLATYASYLVPHLNPSLVTVLAEKVAVPPLKTDESFVVRCWTRGDTNFSELLKAIESNQIEVLYINGHYRFFPQPEFGALLHNLRERGVQSIVHLHSTFTKDDQLEGLVEAADRVIVHSKESRLEVIANNATADAVKVVPHGVVISPYRDVNRDELRGQLGLSPQEYIVSCFGFIQPHKGMEGLIEGVVHLRKLGVPARGLILGSPPQDDPNGKPYADALHRLAAENGVSEYVTFSERFLDDDEVLKHLSASDAVLMNYRSQHYEASGAGALAVGSGAVVLTSLAPPFQAFKDAVWHLSSGYPIPLALELMLTNVALRKDIRTRARAYADRHSWERVGKSIQTIINSLKNESITLERKENGAMVQPVKILPAGTRLQKASALRVLMQNRQNAFTQRGGDTVVMERTKAGLEARGVTVVIDVEGKEDPAQFDIVHLFNFAIPDLVRYYGERAVQANVPFVVTTLCEDIPTFHNQSVAVGRTLIEYVARGQDKAWYEQHRIRIDQIQGCSHFENAWAVQNAAALLVNGQREADTLRRDYTTLGRVAVVPVGYDLSESGSADLFEREYGVRDFILCVGRLETRKNQLMLLKAFEEIDLPIVIAAGGFSYQPDYTAAVRNFKRAGKTLVLDRLSSKMLASAYAAARVHVLPSWYELPGLVSLEAAHHGCNVVATEMGTAPDYFDTHAFYCNPSSESSIVHAALAAYYSPLKEGLKEVAMKNSWDYAAEKTLEAYESVVQKQARPTATSEERLVVVDLESSATEFQDLLERGEIAAKSKEFEEAHKLFTLAERINPRSARLLRARGAVYLAEGQVELARQNFERGILIDPANAKLLCGLGMCAMQSSDYDLAHERFSKALELAPGDLVAILQLIECSYYLNRFDGLERALRRYTDDHPNDPEMLYCLAGCMFKKGEIEEATQLAHQVLEKRVDHLGAKQLLSAIEEAQAGATGTEGQRSPHPSAAEESSVAAGSVEAVQPKTEVVEFDSNDEKIFEIDELKRKKEYDLVHQKCEDILSVASLRDDQLEKITLIRAEIKVLQGEIREAEAMYDAVLSKNPDSARGLCGKGAISANRDQWNEARAFFEQANVLAPSYDVPWAGLGVTSFWAKDYERAWECFNKAISINPENIRALLGIIELGYPLKRLEAIEQALKGYLEMHPVDLEFQYALAGCYFAQDKLNEATSEINKITLFNPEHQKALELRGMIEEKLQTPASNAF